jgi:hypothetical protein
MKTTFASFITTLCLLVGSPSAEEQALENADGNRGSAHLAQLTAQPWLADWKGAALEDIRLVEPKKDQAWPTGLAAVWRANIVNAKGATGYLAWDAGAEGRLVEFAFDANLLVETPTAKALRGVAAFQQFAIPQEEGKAVASGCIPTSAASLLGYWIDRAYPQWRGDAGDDPLPPLTKRIRARLTMHTIPDNDGYTDDGMMLAGAMPDELARAIQADANEHRVPIQVSLNRFRFETLQTEIGANRPVLLSCTVRLPHKPQLSWGHEVAGIGWMKIGDLRFVGIADNFYPVKNPETIRWIRTDAFKSLIAIRTKAE